MSFDKLDIDTTLATATGSAQRNMQSEAVPDSLRLAGADFVKRGKVKYRLADSAASGQSELTGTVQCGFGIVHHPLLAVLSDSEQLLVQRFQCGCREGVRGNFCAHCAALLVAHYGHADAVMVTDSQEMLTEANLKGLFATFGV